MMIVVTGVCKASIPGEVRACTQSHTRVHTQRWIHSGLKDRQTQRRGSVAGSEGQTPWL